MTFIPTTIVNTETHSVERETKVIDNDQSEAMEELIRVQKLVVRHLEEVNGEVFTAEDINKVDY